MIFMFLINFNQSYFMIDKVNNLHTNNIKHNFIIRLFK